METIREYQHITEHCFLSKNRRVVAHFLDGSCFYINIDDLPKDLQAKKLDWANSVLSDDKKEILVSDGQGLRSLPAHLFHAKGKEL